MHSIKMVSSIAIDVLSSLSISLPTTSSFVFGVLTVNPKLQSSGGTLLEGLHHCVLVFLMYLNLKRLFVELI